MQAWEDAAGTRLFTDLGHSSSRKALVRDMFRGIEHSGLDEK